MPPKCPLPTVQFIDFPKLVQADEPKIRMDPPVPVEENQKSGVNEITKSLALQARSRNNMIIRNLVYLRENSHYDEEQAFIR